MKIRFLYLLFLSVFIFTGCEKMGKVSFCTGIDKEGEGVSCGSVFTTGDLNIMVELPDPMEGDSIKVKIFEEQSGHLKPYKEKVIKLENDKQKFSFDFSFYNEGNYTVKAYGKNEKPVASGELQVIEDF